MDSINIENLIIFAHHGVFPEEKFLGQKFQLDIKLFLDTQSVALSNDLSLSVHYGELIEEVKREFTKESIDLIETAAENLAYYILSKPIVKEVVIRVKKPWAPVLSELDNIFVEIERRRNKAFIGIGTNMEDREANIENALKNINAPHTKIIKQSRIIENKAWGVETQDDFLNMVIEIETYLSPECLLKFLQEIEINLGRVKNYKWGPRTIDLDILFYNDDVIYEEDLIIPHPYIEERSFILEPLNEIAPFYIHPVSKKQIRILKNEFDIIRDKRGDDFD